MKVSIDKKKKYALSVGEKIELDVEHGTHRIDCSLNLLKATAEINYPKESHIIVSFRVSPSGINIQIKSNQ